jgi:hypothetical protein
MVARWSWVLLSLVALSAQAQPNVRVSGRGSVDVFTRERFGLRRLDAANQPVMGPAVDLVVSLDGGRFDLADGGFETTRVVTIPAGAFETDGGFFRVVAPGRVSLRVSGPGFTTTEFQRTARPTFIVEDFEGTLFDVEEPPGTVTGQLVIGPGFPFFQCFGIPCVDAGVRPGRVALRGRGGSTALRIDDPGGPFTHYQFGRAVRGADPVRAFYGRLWIRPTVRASATPLSFFRFFEVATPGGLALFAVDLVGPSNLRLRHNSDPGGAEFTVFTGLDGGWHLVETEVTGLSSADAGIRVAVDGTVSAEVRLSRTGAEFVPSAVTFGSVFSGASGLDLLLEEDDLAVALGPMASRLTLSTATTWEAGRCEPVVITLRDSFDGGPAPSFFALPLEVSPAFTLFTAADCGAPLTGPLDGLTPTRTLYARTLATGRRDFAIDSPTLVPTTPVSILVLPAADGGAAGGGTAGGGAAGGSAGGVAGGSAAGGTAGGSAGGVAGGSAAGGAAGASAGGVAGGSAGGGATAGGSTAGGASAGGTSADGGMGGGAPDGGIGSPSQYAVGCTCDSTSDLLFGALLVLARRARRPQRR